MREDLLKEVRDLQDSIDRYTDSTHPDAVARRNALLHCLEWRLHKLNEHQRLAADKHRAKGYGHSATEDSRVSWDLTTA
jgi:hypothetical protein